MVKKGENLKKIEIRLRSWKVKARKAREWKSMNAKRETLSSKVPWESQTCMEKGDASRQPKSENGMYPSPLRQTCMPKPSMDRTFNTYKPTEGRSVLLREMKRGEREEGETAAKGDYKEKYSPHSLPTHALQGDYAVRSAASLATLHDITWKKIVQG